MIRTNNPQSGIIKGGLFMKIRLLSTVICAAMVSTMVMGCSSGASAPATTAAAAAAPETEVKDTTGGDTETA